MRPYAVCSLWVKPWWSRYRTGWLPLTLTNDWYSGRLPLKLTNEIMLFIHIYTSVRRCKNVEVSHCDLFSVWWGYMIITKITSNHASTFTAYSSLVTLLSKLTCNKLKRKPALVPECHYDVYGLCVKSCCWVGWLPQILTSELYVLHSYKRGVRWREQCPFLTAVLWGLIHETDLL